MIYFILFGVDLILVQTETSNVYDHLTFIYLHKSSESKLGFNSILRHLNQSTHLSMYANIMVFFICIIVKKESYRVQTRQHGEC